MRVSKNFIEICRLLLFEKNFFFFYSFVELGITKDDIRNLKQGFQGEIVKFIFNDEEMGLKAENIAYDKVDEYFDD